MKAPNKTILGKNDYQIRTTQLTVLRRCDRIFAESATTITVVDEAGGEFLEIKQDIDHDEKLGTIRLDGEEWPIIKRAVDTLFHDMEIAEEDRAKFNE